MHEEHEHELGESSMQALHFRISRLEKQNLDGRITNIEVLVKQVRAVVVFILATVLFLVFGPKEALKMLLGL